MQTRRSMLLAGAASLLAAPAFARRPHVKPHAPGHSASGVPLLQTDVPANTPLGPIDTPAHWAILVDYNTGATLLDKSADERMPPSSLTKLMTLYIIYTQLKEGRLKLDQQLPVSEKAWKTGGSKMFVMVGTTVSVEDLIRGIIVDSGNDACIVIAEGVAGSEDQFVKLMNAQAKKLGLTNSHFENCTGLPDPGHYMSVRDIATLAADIIRDFPEYYHFQADKTFKYSNIEQANRNTLVLHGEADGLKTGHTEAGGYGICASAEHDGRRLIVVVNGMDTFRGRTEEALKLMDWGFRSFEDVTLFTAGDTIDNARVWLGTQPTVPLVSARNLVVTMPHGWRKNVHVSVQYQAPVPAPVRRGTVLGKLLVSGTGAPPMELPLLAGADVPRLGLPGRALAVLSHYVKGI